MRNLRRYWFDLETTLDSLRHDLTKRVDAMYDEAAKACVGRLHCTKCKLNYTCSPEDANYYLRYGWPYHHGEQMCLEKP